jgi:hypothetical protein
VTVPRELIAGQPEPGRVFGRAPRFMRPYLYPFLPQQAWLQGRLLIVERFQEVSQCDLATAALTEIRSVKPVLSGFGWSFDVLHACQTLDSAPTRLVLTGPDWYLLTGDEYRRLAQILSSRTDTDRKIGKVIRRLQDYGTSEDFRSQPTDWSFRTDPSGTRAAHPDSAAVVRAATVAQTAVGPARTGRADRERKQQLD